jgi:predicted metal-dependent phosphoesterase TrpH
LIDLHTHTTASDGRRSPASLVEAAAAAGVTVLGVTDHDTVAGCAAAQAACDACGLTFVPGIELTSVREAIDVHVLGYFIDTASPPLASFLAEQRSRRIERVRQMILRLGKHGIELDADSVLRPAVDDPTVSAGRPWIARALVERGYCETTSDAFARWLSRGRPAFVPRLAAAPEEVFARIHAAGGVASLAHPVLTGRDKWIPEFTEAGLDALEAYHTKQNGEDTRRYVALADRLGLAVSGGSDYHGDESHGAVSPGCVALPSAAFDALREAARTRPSARR